ncbi:Type 1 glutamine amidotransferase-like domain-containing protein [Rhodococcoides fascians]|uniref:Type 1 glutamine amidotransferase-like domain-containing protein n=1 Tax=Rhodococcoides fascians TaxID=1828 RepID=UPI0005601EAF|nr:MULTISPECIES: Type 1 glutamine amidotransferase-like domain-containing protein [Rhodococcus]OZE97409.1 peptidase [Rhodococcus sp. 15-1189-1-1a]OZF12102.1 peptidase [Rhodococcus sp. 14-2686-1-2]
MKLFLASYRFGTHVDEFLALTSGPGRVAVIANAADAWPASARQSAVVSELRSLSELGYVAEELDLRRFRTDRDALRRELDAVDTVWIRGGNTFVLQARLEMAGADGEIASRVRDGSLVFAGYSAGACIASPSLRGVESADDPADVEAATGRAASWTGLGLTEHSFVPHFGSILDEEGAAQAMVSRFERENVPYLTLTDEQVVVVDGDRLERL